MTQRQRKSGRVLGGFSQLQAFITHGQGRPHKEDLEMSELLTCTTMSTVLASWCLAIDYKNKSMSTKPK